MKKEKSIYLHAGLAKTGTTTLQYGLRDNAELLLQHGWLYPKSGRNYQEGSVHHNIAFDVQSNPLFVPKEGGVTELVSEIKNSSAQNIIISSENFPKGIKPLIEILGEVGQVKIIVYLRRQVHYLPSLWKQLVKTCHTGESFAEWYQTNSQKGIYRNLLSLWSETIGQENILIKPFERCQIHGHILEDFLESIGFINTRKLIIPDNKNISPSQKTVEIIRYFTNKFGVPNQEKWWLHFSKYLSSVILDFSEKENWSAQKYEVMSRDLFLEIEQNYIQENREIAKEFLNQNELFLEDLVYEDYGQFNIEDLSSREVLDLMTYVLDSILQEPRKIIQIRNYIDDIPNTIATLADNSLSETSGMPELIAKLKALYKKQGILRGVSRILKSFKLRL